MSSLARGDPPGQSAHGLVIPTLTKKVLMDVGEDEEYGEDDFADVKYELFMKGHHLTSVLMNPRESFLDDLFDEFANEQSAPLEYQSPISTSGSLFGGSQHSISFSVHAPSPSSVSAQRSIHSSHHSAHATQIVTLSLTQTELQSIEKFGQRMQKIFKIYHSAHPNSVQSASGSALHSSSQHNLNVLSTPRLARSNSNSGPALTSFSAQTPSAFRSKRLAADDLRVCYDKVPPMFFRSDFTLTSNEFFQATLNLIDTRPAGSPRLTGYTINLEELSQDRLSSYLDLVEVALLRQIWSRSNAFFRALDDLKGLQHVVHESTNHLRYIRERLTGIARNYSSAMKIPVLHRRQSNALQLHTKLVYVQQVLTGRKCLLQLLEVEDYFNAQEVVQEIKRVYLEHCQQVVALRGVGEQLNDIETVIGDVLCNKFVTLGIQWEEMEVDHNSQETSASGLAVGNPAGFGDDVETRDSANDLASLLPSSSILEKQSMLTTLLTSLLTNGKLESAMGAYRSRLLDGIKLIIRTCVMEYLSNFDLSDDLFLGDDVVPDGDYNSSSNSNGNGAASSVPYSRRVREMSGENFLACLAMCYEQVSLSLKKAFLFHHTFAGKLNPGTARGPSPLSENASSSSSPPVDSEVYSHLQVLEDEFKFSHANLSLATTDSSGSGLDAQMSSSPAGDGLRVDKDIASAFIQQSRQCLQAACDVAQKSLAQLINIRKENNARMSYPSMKQLWELSLAFITSIEKYNHHSTAFALRQCLLIQFKLFCECVHDQYKTSLVNTLDSERWAQCDVNAERQREVHRLTSGKAFLQLLAPSSSSSTLPSHGASYSTYPASISAGIGGSNVGSEERKKEARPVMIEQTEYRVTWSVLLLTEQVMTYLDIAYHFSPILTEIIHKIVELIRLFNTRTKQLVLGAQAIQSAARLKSITAKHLGITAQSVSYFVVLLPHIRAALLAQLPAKHHLLLTELDRISQELFDHHQQISGKFVTIVSDMMEASAMKLKLVDWDRIQHGTASCEYFEDVQKNVLTLHKVLNTVLPPNEIEDIFLRIFNLLNRKVVQHFEEIMPSTVTGKQRILDEITHLVITLSKLKHVNTSVLTSQLEDQFRKRYAR